jgi:hypothetical protein
MAKRSSTTPNAFGLQSSLDMLKKLQRDYFRLARSTERQDAIDHGLNVAMAAWHMVDWVWAEMKHSPERLAELGIPEGGKQAFQDYVLNACPELRYCQIIATSAKHLGYEIRPEDPRFDTRVEPAAARRVDDHGQEVLYDKRQMGCPSNGPPTPGNYASSREMHDGVPLKCSLVPSFGGTNF